MKLKESIKKLGESTKNFKPSKLDIIILGSITLAGAVHGFNHPELVQIPEGVNPITEVIMYGKSIPIDLRQVVRSIYEGMVAGMMGSTFVTIKYGVEYAAKELYNSYKQVVC